MLIRGLHIKSTINFHFTSIRFSKMTEFLTIDFSPLLPLMHLGWDLNIPWLSFSVFCSKETSSSNQCHFRKRTLKRVIAFSHFSILFYFLRFYLFIFRERDREGEREGEKHQCAVASWEPLTGDLAHNPCTCPDWESNQWPFGSQAGTQSIEPHQPGLICI